MTMNRQTELQSYIEELKSELAQWKERAQKDALTGLLRRDAALELINQRKKFGYCPQNLAVTVCDLDFFKHVNDQYGHQAGDEVLKMVAQLLKKHSPNSTVLARWGGEEFVLILECNQLGEAHEKLEIIRTAIAEAVIKVGINQELSITASFGVSLWNTDQEKIDVALERADSALYLAKDLGRNRIAA